jgi:hypothetical protein
MKKQILILISIVFLSSIHAIKAQEMPEWANKLPQKKGYVYGVGRGESVDMTMAKRKAESDAKADLVNHYANKFEVFALQCDTLLGADNSIRAVVTTIQSHKEAVLDQVEMVEEKMYKAENGGYVFYLLVRMNVQQEVDNLKNQVEQNSDLKNKMKEKGLLKELKNM